MNIQYWLALPLLFIVLICIAGLIAKRLTSDKRCDDCKKRDHYYAVGQPLPEETRKCTCNK